MSKSEVKAELTVVELLERILDSKHECDKWAHDAELMYVKIGGTRLSLIAPTARERIAAKLAERSMHETFNAEVKADTATLQQKENYMKFNLSEAKALLEVFGGSDAEITVTENSDGQKLAYTTEYPEEGSVEL